jgi:class 3 adenylate cyclase
MTTNPNEPQQLKFRPNRTFICSVVFVDIVEYSKKSVNEQIQLKERFNALLTEAIKDISVNDRIVLDTGDGAAVGFLGDPEDALFVAMSLRDALKDDETGETFDLHVRMGINLGPVKLLKDINNQLNLIGDGINVAQRIMNFAEPGQLLVSRSYYDIVSCLSQEFAKLFRYQGASRQACPGARYLCGGTYRSRNRRNSKSLYITFKKAGKGVKALNLHPFIYEGRSGKEHDLVMNLRR